MANAKRDQNRVPTVIGVSSLDLRTPTNIAVNPVTGALLIDAASISGTFVLKAGDTMTGALQFSGATNAGLILNSLTTTQRNALTPTNGNLIYNSTIPQLQSYANGQWTDISKSPATKVVAPAGSGFAADYYTTGTNDDLVIQTAVNALNALGGGVLELVQGTYTGGTGTGVILYANITVRGWGIGKTIIKNGNSTHDFFYIGSNGGTGSGTADPAGTFQNINFYDFEFDSQTTGGSCIALYAPGNVHIERLYVHDTDNFGIYVVNSNGLYIKDSYVKNIIGNGGIQLKGCYDTWVNNNKIYNVVHGSLSKGIGSHDSDGTYGRQGQNVHILDNNLDTVTFGIDCEDSYSEVCGNSVINFVVAGIESRTNPVSLDISHNRVTQSTSGGAVGISTFFLTSGASNITIDHNIIINVNSDSSSDGIFVGTNVANGSVTNNTIVNSGRYAIYNRALNLVVDSNLMTGNASGDLFNDTGATYLGYRINQYTSPSGQTLIVKGGDADALSVNANGGAVNIEAGIGTGNSGSSIISFFTASGSNGNSAQTLAERMRLAASSNGRLWLGQNPFPSNSGGGDGITMAGNVSRLIINARNPSNNLAGNTLTIQSGGATFQATNKNAGNLILASGVSTGSGTGQILFQTAPASSGATGTLQSIGINNRGSGYSVNDVLTISGGGANATATVNTVAVAGVLSTIAINAGGLGYVVNDVLTVSGGSSGTITVNAVSATGAILLATLTTGGSGYTAGSNQATTGGTGTGGTFNTTIYLIGAILTISLTAIGTGYSLTTNNATTGGTGTTATFNIVPFDNADNSPVTRMTISSSGIDVSSLNITSLATPVNSTDAATKGYVDSAVGGDVTSISGTSNRITASASTGAVTLDISGSYVGQSSITTLGTITAGTWSATTIAINKGGTGQVTASAAFDSLSPMTTLGDIIYGGTSGTNTRLAGNATSTKKFLRQTGTGSVSAAPAWDTVTSTDVGLGNVENTALSTWAGSTNITTLGTIATGVWSGTAIDHSKLTGIVQADVGGLTTGSSPTFAGLSLGTGALNTVGNIEIDGTAARDITVGRASSGAGNIQLIQAGGAQSGATDTAGGDLQLKSGISTGAGTSTIRFYTTSAGGSGIGDTNPGLKMSLLSSSGFRLFLGSDTSPAATSDGFGMNANAAKSLYMNRHTTANTAGNSLTVKAGDATTSATDKNGGSLILKSGIATGTGSGIIQFQTSKASASGAVSTLASAPTSGGTGYTVNDVLTITTGGTGATATVTTVSSGVVTAVTLTTGGSGYTTGTGKATTGGTGTGCTLNISAIDGEDNALATVLTILGSGNIQLTNQISTYNNIATVSNGVPSELATIDSTGLTANVTASTLYAVPASGAGLYRISAYLVTTTAASVSSTMPNAQVVYTDSDSNTSVTLDVSPILGAAGLGQSGLLTANAVGTVFSGTVVIYAKASTTIQYQTVNYSSTAAGLAYALRMKLEAL